MKEYLFIDKYQIFYLNLKATFAKVFYLFSYNWLKYSLNLLRNQLYIQLQILHYLLLH